MRMIGHLSARMIGGRPPIELDLDAVLDAAEATGTALEVNGGLPRLDMSVEALRRARTREVTFVLTSDAHQTSELERVRYAALNAERAWIGPERVANAWTGERLLAWTEKKSARGIQARCGRRVNRPRGHAEPDPGARHDDEEEQEREPRLGVGSRAGSRARHLALRGEDLEPPPEHRDLGAQPLSHDQGSHHHPAHRARGVSPLE